MDNKSGQLIKVLKGRWVLPMSSEATSNACVLISGQTIENVIPESQLNEFVKDRQYVMQDYGNSIILPGLINLHTHLEHTNLRSLAKKSSFLDWLPALMEATANWTAADRVNSAKCGLEESMATGTTFVVDTSYNGASAIPLAESGLRAIIGLETFGLDESTAKEQWQQWLDRYNNLLAESVVNIAQQEGRVSITVSPHAPYTVCPALWQQAANWSKDKGLPILAHLAESQAELNWFRSQDQDLKQFLIYAFGKRTPGFAQFYQRQTGWKKANITPVEHLHKHGLLTDNLLAAHGVQINDYDISLLRSGRVSIAHCPRSNIALQCGRAPLEKLLANNIKVGLGTDSAASSNNLDLLAEANFAINLHRSSKDTFDLSARQALELVTIKAAQCLGLDDKLGCLQPGNLADIAIFTLPERNWKNGHREEPYSLLVEGFCKVEELLVNGRSVYSSNRQQDQPTRPINKTVQSRSDRSYN